MRLNNWIRTNVNTFSFNVVFSYACTYTDSFTYTCRIIMAQWIKTSEDFFRKICTSHFIVRVQKGLLRVLLWEGVVDRTELKYIDPHSYGRQRCVFIVPQGCSTGGPGDHLSAGWWLSLLHLITNRSPKLHRGSRGPLRPGVVFPITSCLRRLWSPTVWLPVLT